MLLKKYKEFTPKIDGAYVAEDVSVIGDVEIGENASIWYSPSSPKSAGKSSPSR